MWYKKNLSIIFSLKNDRQSPTNNCLWDLDKTLFLPQIIPIFLIFLLKHMLDKEFEFHIY